MASQANLDKHLPAVCSEEFPKMIVMNLLLHVTVLLMLGCPWPTCNVGDASNVKLCKHMTGSRGTQQHYRMLGDEEAVIADGEEGAEFLYG